MAAIFDLETTISNQITIIETLKQDLPTVTDKEDIEDFKYAITQAESALDYLQQLHDIVSCAKHRVN